MGTLWEGRLSGATTDALKALNDSLEIDKRLYREDILGSIAHVEMLVTVGLIEESDGALILDALKIAEEEISSGSFVFQAEDEDIHTALERRVTEIAGVAGARMHTGRSRNDQVVTDLRLWTLKSLDELALLVMSLQKSLIEQAKKAGETRLHGYTHLQQAQPVLLSHHLLAHDRFCQQNSGHLHHPELRLLELLMQRAEAQLSGQPWLWFLSIGTSRP